MPSPRHPKNFGSDFGRTNIDIFLLFPRPLGFMITLGLLVLASTIEGVSIQQPAPATEKGIDNDKSTPIPVQPPQYQDIEPQSVSPAVFYSARGLYIRCFSAETLTELGPSDAALAVDGMDPLMWENLTGDDIPKEKRITKILSYHKHCRRCICTAEGKMIYSTSRTSHCTSQFYADRCTYLYRCFCTAQLEVPSPLDLSDPLNTLENFRDAINQIPETVRNDNHDWTWEVPAHLREYPGQRLTWRDNPTLDHIGGDILGPPTGFDVGWIPEEPFIVYPAEPDHSQPLGPGPYVRGWEFWGPDRFGGSGGGGFFRKRASESASQIDDGRTITQDDEVPGQQKNVQTIGTGELD
ncbi:hypothetical protein TWF281_006821 [Arthrobotrys megalospora]